MTSRVSRSLAAVSVAALLSISVAGWGQQTPAGQPPAREPGQKQPGQDGAPGRERGEPGERGPGGGGGRPQSVQQVMKGVNRSFKQLRAQIDDPAKKDDNLRLIGECERGAVTAKNMGLPADVLEQAAKDEAQKAKVNALYRADLIAAIRKMLEIEEDTAAGKTDSAKARLEELIKMRDEAHDALGVKED